MELVIGGAYQGKLSWAVAQYGLRKEELCDLDENEPQAGKRCYYHLEAYTRRHSCDAIPEAFQDAVLIVREIGCGVVPMDAQERAWRERHGACVQALAARATHVTRIFCGLPERLK